MARRIQYGYYPPNVDISTLNQVSGNPNLRLIFKLIPFKKKIYEKIFKNIANFFFKYKF